MDQAAENMKILSTVTVQRTDDFYKVVDQLNRTLKEKGLTFGFSLDDKDDQKITLTIYET